MPTKKTKPKLPKLRISKKHMDALAIAAPYMVTAAMEVLDTLAKSKHTFTRKEHKALNMLAQAMQIFNDAI